MGCPTAVAYLAYLARKSDQKSGEEGRMPNFYKETRKVGTKGLGMNGLVTKEQRGMAGRNIFNLIKVYLLGIVYCIVATCSANANAASIILFASARDRIGVAIHFRKSSNAFSSFWNVSSRRSTSGDIFRQSKSKE